MSGDAGTSGPNPDLVLLALLALLVAAGTWEFVRLRATDRRWILTGALPGWRALRSELFRVLLWFLSWPHVVDRIIGTHRAPVAATASREVMRWPGGRLLHYGAPGGPSALPPVLIVHSLVTRPWILDLAPGCSLVEALTTAGREVFLLDWDEPDRATAAHTVLDKSALVRSALEVAGGRARRPVHVVGYCSGAPVALLATAVDAGGVASLSLIAPMVDAAARGGMQAVMTARWLLPPLLLDGHGCVPAAAIRESFHLLRPMAVRAARQRWRLRRDPAASRIAGALTRWTWEQRPLSGGVFFDLVDMFRTNPLMGDGWPAGGTALDIRRITTPTLVVVSERDHIVPPPSSLALTRLLSGPVQVTRSPGGHVSMVAGVDAPTTLYPAVLEWLDQQDAAASSPTARITGAVAPV
ncbi:MAG TPA: alpha/beta fold hydrolase [Mycobacteriales bacterium]|nr:alpha/beta fold hydrolase [Mycobacteriales bacterium]